VKFPLEGQKGSKMNNKTSKNYETSSNAKLETDFHSQVEFRTLKKL
jgi:hypothetical protein